VKEFSQIKVLSEDLPAGKGKKKPMKATHELQQDIIEQIKATKCWGCELLSYHIT
jgi:hypothetical protein